MTSEMLINQNFVATPMFEKRTIAELSIDEMEAINGGATPATVTLSSTYCVGVGVAVGIFVVGAVVGYFSK